MNRRISLRKGKGPWPTTSRFGTLRIGQLFYLSAPGEEPRMLLHKSSLHHARVVLNFDHEGSEVYQYFPPDYMVHVI
jgi:hypothetical protein